MCWQIIGVNGLVLAVARRMSETEAVQSHEPGTRKEMQANKCNNEEPEHVARECESSSVPCPSRRCVVCRVPNQRLMQHLAFCASRISTQSSQNSGEDSLSFILESHATYCSGNNQITLRSPLYRARLSQGRFLSGP